jgi:hypothetical protein
LLLLISVPCCTTSDGLTRLLSWLAIDGSVSLLTCVGPHQPPGSRRRPFWNLELGTWNFTADVLF